MYFSYLPCTKYTFLPYVANKTMACYTFSVRPIIPESKNLKTAMKEIDEEENEDFWEEEYFIFEALNLGEK